MTLRKQFEHPAGERMNALLGRQVSLLSTQALAEKTGLEYHALRKRINREQSVRGLSSGAPVILGLMGQNYIGEKHGRDWIWQVLPPAPEPSPRPKPRPKRKPANAGGRRSGFAKGKSSGKRAKRSVSKVRRKKR